MQAHIWYYKIIDTIQYEDLVQVFSLRYSISPCWVNRLNIAINNGLKYGEISETTKCLNYYLINYILLKPSILQLCFKVKAVSISLYPQRYNFGKMN